VSVAYRFHAAGQETNGSMRSLIKQFKLSLPIGRTGLVPLNFQNQGRLRAIQLLLGAELAQLYEVFLQQPVPPGISRLLDKLAQSELDQLR
jgi:hypothetical protein